MLCLSAHHLGNIMQPRFSVSGEGLRQKWSLFLLSVVRNGSHITAHSGHLQSCSQRSRPVAAVFNLPRWGCLPQGSLPASLPSALWQKFL